MLVALLVITLSFCAYAQEELAAEESNEFSYVEGDDLRVDARHIHLLDGNGYFFAVPFLNDNPWFINLYVLRSSG